MHVNLNYIKINFNLKYQKHTCDMRKLYWIQISVSLNQILLEQKEVGPAVRKPILKSVGYQP